MFVDRLTQGPGQLLLFRQFHGLTPCALENYFFLRNNVFKKGKFEGGCGRNAPAQVHWGYGLGEESLAVTH